MRISWVSAFFLAVPFVAQAGMDCRQPQARYEDPGCASEALA